MPLRCLEIRAIPIGMDLFYSHAPSIATIIIYSSSFIQVLVLAFYNGVEDFRIHLLADMIL